jgi:hypothetical protein
VKLEVAIVSFILLKRVPLCEMRGFHTLSDKDFTALLCDAMYRGCSDSEISKEHSAFTYRVWKFYIDYRPRGPKFSGFLFFLG